MTELNFTNEKLNIRNCMNLMKYFNRKRLAIYLDRGLSAVIWKGLIIILMLEGDFKEIEEGI